jgi:hypothetical protein
MGTEQRHTLLVVAGRFDHPAGMAAHVNLTRPFIDDGFDLAFHRIGWKDTHENFPTKLEQIVDRVERMMADTDSLSLVGVSAGGAPAIAALMEVPEIHRVVAIGSRLNLTTDADHTSLEEVQSRSPLLIEACSWLEEHTPSMPPELKAKVMTVNARSGEERVHPHSRRFDGGTNHVVPYDAFGHNDAINAIIKRRVYRDSITVFLRGE